VTPDHTINKKNRRWKIGGFMGIGGGPAFYLIKWRFAYRSPMIAARRKAACGGGWDRVVRGKI